jgi:hypothetical protein
MAELSFDDAQTLVRALAELNKMADRVLPHRSSPLTARLRQHLGSDGGSLASTSIKLPGIERVNVQLAFNAYQQATGTWDVIGLQSDVANYSGVSLPSIVSGAWYGPGEVARQFEEFEVDVDETLPCLQAGIVLTEFEGDPVASLMMLAERYPPTLVVEVAATEQHTADGFLRRLRDLMHEHNAFRRKVVSFSFGMHGEFGLRFVRLPKVARDQVVLAPGELEAIESHSIGISDHAEGLRAAGQHVKRGLLLYGPPGTGKTHTISYLVGSMRDRTTIVLSGPAVGAVGQAGTIARALQPATIVIEDVDLIGMDRELAGHEHNPMLFQLLNEMDGLAEDADVLFVLTTNRVDMLEPALAARPGRVDQAIELSLPDAAGRRRLIELYDGAPLSDGDALVARLHGVAPAFIKELARRAALLRLQRGDVSTALTDALDAMLEHATPVLRRSLSGPAAGD